jgi:glutamate synthase (NADPH/NADH) small chain
MWLSAPKAFVGKDKVNQVLVQRMRLTTHDNSGRQSVVPVEGENFPLATNMVIKALGFDAEDLPVMFGTPELGLSKWGTLNIDQSSFMTNVPGVFAAGDIVRGASLVVWAIRDGRDAAEAMHRHLLLKQAGSKAA